MILTAPIILPILLCLILFITGASAVFAVLILPLMFLAFLKTVLLRLFKIIHYYVRKAKYILLMYC
jgi:hypothetical protein